MDSFAWRSSFVDVFYRDEPWRIACGVLETESGLVLVDPGPESSLANLERGLRTAGWGWADVRAVLLTHIHLDHAGATGSIVARNPAIRVYVHEVGAPHLVNPERLLNSAKRLYGDQMKPLWGEFLAVPEQNVHPLAGGERIDPDGRPIDVCYTPGHAVHHVTYLDLDAGTAFVGDTAGMKMPAVDYVLPVAPPPDIQVEAWQSSVEQVRRLGPDRLFLTHFGPSSEVDRHLARFSAELQLWAELVARSLEEEDADDERRAERFEREVYRRLPPALSTKARRPYLYFGQVRPSWYGLARYWRKRHVAETVS